MTNTPWFAKAKAWHGILFLGLFCVVYFLPQVLGKSYYTHDSFNANKGMGAFYKEAERGVPYWNDNRFAGMPTYVYYHNSLGNQFQVWPYLDYIFNSSFAVKLFMMASMFFCMMYFGLKVSVIFSVLTAILFSWSTYNIDILRAGHEWKVHAIIFSLAFFWSLFELFLNRRYLLGFILSALAMCLMVVSKHYQVMYYVAISVLIFWGVRLVFIIKQKTNIQQEYIHFAKSSILLAVGVLIGIGLNITAINTLREFAKETIRGKSELVSDNSSSSSSSSNTGGLDVDYAFMWSYGKLEFIDMFFENAMGGHSANTPTTESNTYNMLNQKYGPQQSANTIRQLPLYWGSQPFVGAPYYIGIVCLVVLFITFGYLPKWIRWWFLIAGTLSVCMAFGRHMMWFNKFLFETLPLLNKFRAVSTSMIVFMILMPLVSFYGLDRMLKSTNDQEWQSVLKQRLKYVAAFFGAMLILGFVLPYKGNAIDEKLAQYGLLDTMIQDRRALYFANVFRNLAVSVLIAIGLYYWKTKTSYARYMPLLVCVVAIYDVVGVTWDYLGHQHYEDQRIFKKKVIPQPSPIDREILKDKTYYRVLDFGSGSPMNNNNASQFHFSLGGYDAAKLRRYQELWDRYMAQPPSSKVVTNMLNAKYIITRNNKLILNQDALGSAWFVENIKQVNNANEELDALESINPETTAIIDHNKFEISKTSFEVDSLAYVQQKSIGLNKISYQTNNKKDGFVVFSEIYYPNDRKLFIDGKQVELKRLNYVLSGAFVPKGTHTLSLEFHPDLIKKYKWIEYVALILLILLSLWLMLKERKKND